MDRDLTAREFEQYHDLIYGLTGIHYPSEKLELLSNRVRRRIRAAGVADYDAYRRLIEAPASSELQAFLDSITTNETYLFRCQRHWDFFREWLERRRADATLRQRGMRLWSAAASNGAEACTMLIVLHQVFGEGFGGMPVEVYGTDLCAKVLDEAREARFRPYALSQTPADVVSNYFRSDDANEQFEFDRRLLHHARFERHNLMQRPPVTQPFDAVFVRNVMIYFDQSSREKVLAHCFDVLRPGGLLVVGESESLLSVKHRFDYLQPSIFQKPDPTAVPS